MLEAITEKLASGQIILLDGATGSELQKCGAEMSGETWCAEVNASRPDLVEQVHRSYIAAGADIITANSFASSALSFNAYGRSGEIAALDAAAVAAAKRAAQGTSTAIAGSISTMRPVFPGTDRTDTSKNWSKPQALALFRDKVRGLKDSGVDLLMMEMMRDCDYSLIATEAALESGLPVWVGISVEETPQGHLTGYGRSDQPIEPVIKAFAALQPGVISLMHSSVNSIARALPLLQNHWKGVDGIYPESGHFKSPDWQFEAIIPPESLVEKARQWVAQGVSILGGCCGLGPSHIKALAKEFKK